MPQQPGIERLGLGTAVLSSVPHGSSTRTAKRFSSDLADLAFLSASQPNWDYALQWTAVETLVDSVHVHIGVPERNATKVSLPH